MELTAIESHWNKNLHIGKGGTDIFITHLEEFKLWFFSKDIKLYASELQQIFRRPRIGFFPRGNGDYGTCLKTAFAVHNCQDQSTEQDGC